MNRKSLITLVGAFVTGAALGAVVVRKLMADPESARYVTIIELQRRALETAEKLNARVTEETERRSANIAAEGPNVVMVGVLPARHWIMKNDPLARRLSVQTMHQADKMLAFGLSNFDSSFSQEAMFQMSDMFAGLLKIDTMSVDDLKAVLEPVAVTAILRRVIQSRALPGDCTSKMKHIHTFAYRYKNMILGASRPHEDRIRLYGRWKDGKLVA